MIVDHSRFRKISYQEEMSDRAVDGVAINSTLVDRALERREMAEVGITPPWASLKGHFALRPGELVLVGGYSGHGKSAMINHGGLHCANEGNSVGWLSLELPAEYLFDQLASMSAVKQETHREYLKMFAQWCDNPAPENEWGGPRISIIDRVDVITPEEALQYVIGLRKFFGCDVVILDCLFMISLADDLDAERAFTQSLAAIAKHFDMTVVLVHHLRKPQGDGGEKRLPSKHDFIGSSHLVNVASSVLLCHRNVEKDYAKNSGDEYDDSDACTRLVVAKQRYAPWTGLTPLWSHRESRLLCNSTRRFYAPVEVKTDNREEYLNEGGSGYRSDGRHRGGGSISRPEEPERGQVIPIGGGVAGNPLLPSEGP